MNYALVVGINHYNKRPLKGAVNDATAFANWLKESKQVEEKNLKLLVSTEANEIALDHHIDKAFLEILKDANVHAEEKNRLFFYFSGHGIGVSYSNTGLCLRMWDNELPNYNISSNAYSDLLVNKAVFDEIIIFLDCCRDYDFLIDPRKPALDTGFVGTRQTSYLICYSTVYGKVSHEIKKDPENDDPENRRGAFTSFLLEGLKGDADVDGDGAVSGDDLLKHINSNFKTYALKYNKTQDADGFASSNGININICPVSRTGFDYNYIITFKRNSNISLYDGSFNPILINGAATADVAMDEELKIQLPKGLIKIKDNNSREEKYITNFNLNTLTNEQF